MLLPEKFESIFDVSSEGPSLGSLVNKDGGQEKHAFYIMNKSRDKIKTNEINRWEFCRNMRDKTNACVPRDVSRDKRGKFCKHLKGFKTKINRMNHWRRQNDN